MKNSTRRVSLLLAVMMVLSLFAAFPMMVGAADTNYAKGITPTMETTSTAVLGSAATLTDGVLPIEETTGTTNGTDTVYRADGASAVTSAIIDLGSTKTDISSIMIYAKETSNRSIDENSCYVSLSTDGSTYTKVATGNSSAVSSTSADFTEVTLAFTAAQSARYVKVTMMPASYVLAVGEIEVRNYGLLQGEITTADPTLVDGNYAYGGSYTVSRSDDAEITYNGDTRTDSGNWLTDGYVGSGANAGSNNYTVCYTGTGAVYTITLNMNASKSDVKYITLENVASAYCLPSSVSIKTSTDGLTFSDVTYTEGQVVDAGGATDITYTFTSAVTAKAIQFTFTSEKYVCGFDEFVVGGTGTAPVISSEEESVISANSTVINSNSVTNYAPNGYYQYSENSSGLPNATYTDNAWTGKTLSYGVFGKGDLNDATYATGNYSDAAWVGFAHSEQYNTINGIEIIYDLAAVYGDIDQIVINYYAHAAEEGLEPTYALPSATGVKVSFGDYNGVYGAATTVYAGTITETAGTGYTTFKAQYAVGDLTGNVRFVKVFMPKPDYRLFIDEIEILGASGYTTQGTAPESSEATSSEAGTSSEASTPATESDKPGEADSYAVSTMFDVSLEVSYGTADPDGAGTNFVEGEYMILDVFLTNINVPYTYGVSGLDGYVYFDESKLTPVFKTDVELNGTVGSANPGPVYNWPEYTISVPTLGISYNLFSVEGLCVPYAFRNSDGTYTNSDPANPNQDYTMGKGYIRLNYIINIDNHVAWAEGKGLYDSDAVQFRYYFTVNDGTLDAGEEFYFEVPDSPNATQVGDAVLRAPYYTGASDNTAFQTAFGKGDYVSYVVPATPTYTVEFVVDGVVVDTQTVEEGAAATAPADPVKDGYNFIGWDVAFDNITADTTVTAQFEEIVVAADFFTFAEGADTANIVVSTVADYIYFKAGALTADALKATFVDENITITKSNGTTAVTGTTAVGTTCLITSTINGASETRTIIVLGDVSGDGKINSSDYNQILNCAKGNITFTGVKQIAANVAVPAQATINSSDYNQVLNFAKGNLKKFSTAVK